MQNTQTTRRWPRRILASFIVVYLVGVGLVSGVCLAFGIYHSGQGLPIAVVAGIFFGDDLCCRGVHVFIGGAADYLVDSIFKPWKEDKYKPCRLTNRCGQRRMAVSVPLRGSRHLVLRA